MVVKDLQNKVVKDPITKVEEEKLLKKFSFPKEWIIIEAETMEEAIKEKELLFIK